MLYHNLMNSMKLSRLGLQERIKKELEVMTIMVT